MTKAISSTPRTERLSRSHQKAFRKLVDHHLGESWNRFPEMASSTGLNAFNHRIGANTRAERNAQSLLVDETLRAVEAIPDAAFSGDDYLDRRGFIAMLRTERFFDTDFRRWQVNPQVHADAAVHSIFDLVVRHPGKLSAVSDAIHQRLDALPAYLEAGAACISKPVPLWTELTQKTCDGGIHFLDGLSGELTSSAKSRAGLARSIDRAKQAFVDYAKRTTRRTQGAENAFAIGRDAFEMLMRERLGLDLSLDEARANGRELIAQLEHELAAEARKAGVNNVRKAIERAARQWQPSRPLIEAYRETTKRIHGRLRELNLVSIPSGESLDVLPVPEFMRHQFPTAAYSAPPPFSRRQTGIFWVNDLSLTQSNPGRKADEIAQHFGLEFTAAHEACPGHHLQFSIQNRHPSKIRRLFAHAIFYEGWTLWCEKLCIDTGLVDFPMAKLMQLHDALWRACRIVIDCGLHDGSLTHRAAARLLVERVGFTPARARADVNWYTSSPTVPMSYLLGRLELEKLHASFVKREGWTLREFNDWILSHGAIPWRWILEARLRSQS